MISIGPFPIHVVIVALGAFFAWALARRLARRLPDTPSKAAGGMIVDGLLMGLVAARLGYMAQWWREYAQSPWSMLAIGDGGFTWWVGVPAAILFVWWRSRATPPLRRPVFAGILAGLMIWGAAGGAVILLQRSAPPLPDVSLTTLDGRVVALNSYVGRPVVVNLWASWCPPCRYEMPVFEHAQAAFPHVSFVMVNQGEDAQTIQTFLESEKLDFAHVLRDPASDAMRALGARGLPTTLFFDAQGRMVHAHMGGLTIASLKSTISRRFAATSQPAKDPE